MGGEWGLRKLSVISQPFIKVKTVSNQGVEDLGILPSRPTPGAVSCFQRHWVFAFTTRTRGSIILPVVLGEFHGDHVSKRLLSRPSASRGSAMNHGTPWVGPPLLYNLPDKW